jgi:hypothetical protein
MKRITRFLRKLADLLDPQHDPSTLLTIRIGCDSSEAERTIAEVQRKLETLNTAMEAVEQSRKTTIQQ